MAAPCIEPGCPRAATNGPRCEQHRLEKQRIRSRARGMRHYTAEYRTVSAVLRQAWTADPATRCWLCGRGAIEGDPWQADHVRPGETNSPLRPAHGTCNARRGDNDPPNATM